jgi:hypothetical protein
MITLKSSFILQASSLSPPCAFSFNWAFICVVMGVLQIITVARIEKWYLCNYAQNL